MSSQALPDQTEIAILEYLSEYNPKLLTFGNFAKKKGTTLFGTSNKNGSAAQKVLRKRVENRLNYLKKLETPTTTPTMTPKKKTAARIEKMPNDNVIEFELDLQDLGSYQYAILPIL